MLEAGLRLQEAGLRAVGVATREKEARWKILHRKLRQEREQLERKWKLRSRCGTFRLLTQTFSSSHHHSWRRSRLSLNTQLCSGRVHTGRLDARGQRDD